MVYNAKMGVHKCCGFTYSLSPAKRTSCAYLRAVIGYSVTLRLRADRDTMSWSASFEMWGGGAEEEKPIRLIFPDSLWPDENQVLCAPFRSLSNVPSGIRTGFVLVLYLPGNQVHYAYIVSFSSIRDPMCLVCPAGVGGHLLRLSRSRE